MRYDVVVAFAGGLPPELETNVKIAERASWLGYALNLPVFGEGALPKCHANIQLAPKEKSPTTIKFVERFAEEAKKRGWKSTLVVATPYYDARAARDLRMFGFEAKVDKHLRHALLRPYNKHSQQWRNRHAIIFWPREVLLRLLPWRIYKWAATR